MQKRSVNAARENGIFSSCSHLIIAFHVLSLFSPCPDASSLCLFVLGPGLLASSKTRCLAAPSRLPGEGRLPVLPVVSRDIVEELVELVENVLVSAISLGWRDGLLLSHAVLVEVGEV